MDGFEELTRYKNTISLPSGLSNFFTDPTAEAIAAESECLVATRPEHGAVADAYLAATAEWRAWKFDLPLPAWTRAARRSRRAALVRFAAGFLAD